MLRVLWAVCRSLKKKTAIVPSCFMFKVFLLQHVYCEPPLLCRVASWTADVCWWTQRETLNVITLGKPVLRLLSSHTAWPHPDICLRLECSFWWDWESLSAWAGGLRQCFQRTIVREQQCDILKTCYSFQTKKLIIWSDERERSVNYNKGQEDENVVGGWYSFLFLAAVPMPNSATHLRVGVASWSKFNEMEKSRTSNFIHVFPP